MSTYVDDVTVVINRDSGEFIMELLETDIPLIVTFENVI